MFQQDTDTISWSASSLTPMIDGKCRSVFIESRLMLRSQNAAAWLDGSTQVLRLQVSLNEDSWNWFLLEQHWFVSLFPHQVVLHLPVKSDMHGVHHMGLWISQYKPTTLNTKIRIFQKSKTRWLRSWNCIHSSKLQQICNTPTVLRIILVEIICNLSKNIFAVIFQVAHCTSGHLAELVETWMQKSTLVETWMLKSNRASVDIVLCNVAKGVNASLGLAPRPHK